MRKLLVVALYNVLIICAFFGAAEFAVRKFVYGPGSSKSRTTEALNDRWTAFRNNPAYTVSGVHHTIEGFRRAQPVSIQKSPNTVRIFLLGGSVTYGGDSLYPELEPLHLTDDQTISEYLETMLNAKFPSRKWEVINAGVKGYMLHQDLSLLLSVVLRYRPDCIIFLDGVNDLFGLLRGSDHYDPYGELAFKSEFDALNRPTLRSAPFILRTFLRNESALFHWMQDSASERIRRRNRAKLAQQAPQNPHSLEELAPDERIHYRSAAAQLDHFTNVIRQIHQILLLEKIDDLFVLQPYLLLSNKPLSATEIRLADYHRRIEAGLFIYGFETLYPQVAERLTQDAVSGGYNFRNLMNVFQGAPQQMFTDYCHLTPEGNRAIATQLYSYLAERQTTSESRISTAGTNGQ